MKTILLVLATVAGLMAADQEVLILKDGRSLTGVYDESAEMLDMGMAKLKVKKDEIDHREKAKVVAKPSKNELLDTSNDDPIVEFNAKIAAIEAARVEAVSTLKKKLNPKILSMDLRLVDRSEIRDHGKSQNIDAVNRAISEMQEYVDAVRLQEFLRTTDKEYRKDAQMSDLNDLFFAASPLLTDPIVSASYQASRSMKLIEKSDSKIESEKERYKNWLRERERIREANRDAERQRKSTGNEGGGGGVILGAPKKIK